MDFNQDEADRELAGLARKILTDRLTAERLRAAEAGDGFDPALWADLAGAGILSAALPESLDGAGLGLLAQCSVLTELGRAVAPVPYLPSIMLGAGALARFGTGEQQRRWAVPAARGEVVLTAALAEEDGDDPRAPSATAEPAAGGPTPDKPGAAEPGAGGWVLSGMKTTVPAAPLADLMLVPAATPPNVTVFLVTPADEGVTVQPQRVTGGSAGRVMLDGVRLGADRVLGTPAAGREIAGWLLDRATVGLCPLHLGVVERAQEKTADNARNRVQFGKPIGGFQAVAQRLADGYIDVEAVRLTMWQAAWQQSAGLPSDTAIATAKFWAADAGHRVAHTAVHVHGGVGIDMEYPLHRYFVAAKSCEFTLGGATAQLRRIGTALASEG